MIVKVIYQLESYLLYSLVTRPNIQKNTVQQSLEYA